MSANKVTQSRAAARKPSLYRRSSPEELAERDAVASMAPSPIAPLDQNSGLEAIAATALSAGQTHPAADVVGAAPVPMASSGQEGGDGSVIVIAGQRVTPGVTAMVPLHLLMESRFNARVFYRAQEIDEMAASLQNNGQEVSAEGWIEGGKVWLIDGGKRLRSARAGGIPALRVEIKPKPSNDQSLYLASRRINCERSTQGAIDDAIRFRTLLDEKVFDSQDALGAAVGLKKAMVSTVLSLTRIPERLLQRMKESDVTSGVGVASEIARLFIDRSVEEGVGAAPNSRALDPANGDDLQVLESREQMAGDIIDEVIRRDLTRADVRRLVQSRINGPQRRSRADVREVRWSGFRGHLKVSPERRVLEIALPDVNNEEFQRLVAGLEGYLATSSSAG